MNELEGIGKIYKARSKFEFYNEMSKDFDTHFK